MSDATTSAARPGPLPRRVAQKPNAKASEIARFSQISCPMEGAARERLPAPRIGLAMAAPAVMLNNSFGWAFQPLASFGFVIGAGTFLYDEGQVMMRFLQLTQNAPSAGQSKKQLAPAVAGKFMEGG